ncbi:sensor histidine kinase [Fodinicurvata halophila]|uniref:histidine kinase n=1 Tax=Fodinicurvata halophila TaxID=1419723 RepID=A0ABV8UI62_9PROT
MTKRYYLALLAMPTLDLLLSGLFVSLAGMPQALLYRLPEILVILLAVNLAGGWWLHRPIARFLAGTGEAEPALTALERLAPRAGAWCLMVAAIFSISAFLTTPFLVHGLEPSGEVLLILIARAVAWCVLLPYTAYFLILDYTRRMRRLFFLDYGLPVRPGQATLGGKMILIAAGGILVPLGSIAVTLLFVPEVSPLTGQPRETIMGVTLLGAAVASAIAMRAILLSVHQSLGTLTEGMQRMQAGDFEARIPVESDDELGQLADSFNTLAAALKQSREEAALQQAQREKADRLFHEAQKRDAVGRMAAGIAHDFNNILGIILGYGDMLKDSLRPDETGHRGVDEIITAAERGQALIGRIMTFTRSEEPARQVLDLREVATETVEWLRVTLAPAELDLKSSNDSLPVEGDPVELHQVLANLCVNAAQAMKDSPGRIRIEVGLLEIDGGRAASLRDSGSHEDPPRLLQEGGTGEAHRTWIGLLAAGPHARLSVADAGIGMDGETLQYIFEPYFTTKVVGEGTGLGLAALLGIILDHQGAIAVTTQPGAGTEFEIYLPLAVLAAGVRQEELACS